MDKDEPSRICRDNGIAQHEVMDKVHYLMDDATAHKESETGIRHFPHSVFQ